MCGLITRRVKSVELGWINVSGVAKRWHGATCRVRLRLRLDERDYLGRSRFWMS